MKRNDASHYVAIGGNIDSLLSVLTGWVVDVTLVDGRELSLQVSDPDENGYLVGSEYDPDGDDHDELVSIPWSNIDAVDIP